jgi:hypothetical protein
LCFFITRGFVVYYDEIVFYPPPPPPLSDRFTRNYPAGGLSFLLVLIAATLLIACAPLLDDSGQGNLRIVLGPETGARALSPQTIAGFSYKLDFSGPGGEGFSRTLEPGTQAITLNLALGNWTIRVQAFNGVGLLCGRGEMAVLVGSGSNEASVSMSFSPTWQVASWGTPAGTGSEAAPFATVDAALIAVQAAYAAPDWPGKGTANAAPAHIAVSGTVTAGTGSANGMVDITDTSLYSDYPPVILEGTGTLQAGGTKPVLYTDKADVTLGGNLTLTGGGGIAGVFMGYGTFTMTGGTITGNTNGGVYMIYETFIMTGGTISNNTTNGAVYMSSGTFIMSGGTISNNSAIGDGGGVHINGSFTMNGGTISNNTSGSGGGVYVNLTGSFIKNGGVIYGDTKEDAVTMEDTNLQNTASGNGHAVYVVSTLGNKKRDITAGPGVTLDSGIGSAGSDPWIP